MLVFNPLTGGFDQVGTSSGGGSSGVSSVNGRTGAVTLTSTDVALGNVNNTSDANKPISTATATALGLKADLVSGLIPTSQIPAIAITEFLGTSNSQAAMLALSGQKGDWTIRSDTGATWIITGTDPTQLSNWTAISYPTSPVTSVNAQTGAVVLGFGDVGAQKADATLTALAAMTTAADQLIYATGTDTFATTGFTAFGRSLVDDADAATARTTLQLVIGTNVQAFNADLSALAALSGTNTMYYRSAANTWTAVTVGGGLTFTGGTLAAAGGGGGGDVFLSVANVFTNVNTIDTGSNGTATIDGFVMRNDTAATNAVQQQNSPAIVFEAHGWANGTADYEVEMNEIFRVTPGTSPLIGEFAWEFSENGGSYIKKVYINSAGDVSATGTMYGGVLAATADLQGVNGGYVYLQTSRTLASDSAGGIFSNGGPALLFSRDYAAIFNNYTAAPIIMYTQNSTVSAYRFLSANSLSSGNLIEGMAPTSGFTGSYLKFGTSANGLTFAATKFEVGPSGTITQTQLALGTTTLPGLLLTNTTAAAVGAQQVSPSVRWTGQGWKTNSTAASQAVDFRAYVLPVQAASSPTGEWRLDSAIAGGSFTNIFKVDSAGAVSAVSLTTSGHNTFEGVTATGATGTGKHVYSIAPAFTGQSAFTDASEYPLNVLNNTISASQGIASFLASNLADGSSIFFTLGKSVTATNCATFSFTRNATTTSNRWSVGFFAADNLFNVFQSGGASLGNPGTTTDPGAGNLALAGYIQPSGQAVKWLSGSGSPDGAVAAPVGSLYTRTNGGTGTVLYVKETGAATNLGWAAK